MEAADDWIVAVVAVLALLISIGAFIYSRRATIAAERSTAVSERQEQRQLEEAAERAVRWRFAPEPVVIFSTTPARTYDEGMTQMVNEGDGTAYDVRVELHEGSQVIGGPLLNGATAPSNEWVRLSRGTAGYGEHQEVRVYWRASPDGSIRFRHFDLRGRPL